MLSAPKRIREWENKKQKQNNLIKKSSNTTQEKP